MLRHFLIVFCLVSVTLISSTGYAGKAAYSGGNDENFDILIKNAKIVDGTGISTAFEYIPGLYSNTEEVIEIAKVVREFGGVHASHVRYENAKIVDAIKETVRISREAKIRSNVAHLKVAGKRNWGLMKDVVKVFEKARVDGIEIYADQYPYIQSAPIGSISSFISIPGDMEPISELRAKRRDRNLSVSERKALDDQYNKKFKKALSDPVKRARIRKLTEEGRPNNPSAVAKWGWQDFSVMVSDKYPQYIGKNFIDIADEQGRDIFDIVAEFMIDEPRMLYAGGSQSSEDHAYALKQDWVMVSSDGGASRLVKDTDRPVRGHPRDYGSQAKILRKFVREDKLLTLENAIRKMSSLPASYLQLEKRGLLLEGYKADIAIFNPQTIRDNSTYDNAHQYATGVEYVIVNGKISVDKGKYNGDLNGKLLLLKQQKHP